MIFIAPVNAAGYKENGAWNFLSPLDKQFLLNREAMRLQEKAGGYGPRDYYFITQMNTNIGNMNNINGDGNSVNQDNSGDQDASNVIQSDSHGNMTYAD